MTAFKKIEADPGGWSDWQSPLHGNYRSSYKLSCCDCGLVHDVQFRTRRDKQGRINVFFRMRRNSKSTGAMRAARTRMRKPSPNQSGSEKP